MADVRARDVRTECVRASPTSSTRVSRMTRIWWALSKRLPCRRRSPAPSVSSKRAGRAALRPNGSSVRGNSRPCKGAASGRDHSWGFLALWEWNDAWSAATKAERRAYDEECDVAFKGDVALGINIAGRHRLDWASRWHHAGLWEAPSLGSVDLAMQGHEAAADFKFTTSRHYVGRLRPLADFIEPDAD